MAASRKKVKTLPRLSKKKWKLPPKVRAKAAGKCPKNFKDMCDGLNAWATEWEQWGERVRLVLNCVVDQCCNACDPGDPDPVPPPPKPPFN